jgi:hypothetical protein
VTTSWDYYINFIVLAVTGRTGEADTIMQRFPKPIADCARELTAHFKAPYGPTYRGILVEDDRLKGGILPHESDRTFLSWSENLEVAAWFANRDAIVSQVVVCIRPNVRGYITILNEPEPDTVLWRHSWGPLLEALTGVPLLKAALMHPQVDHRQFLWNLTTQKEVITAPLGELKFVPVEEFDPLPLEQLEEQFCYPEVLAEHRRSNAS